VLSKGYLIEVAFFIAKINGKIIYAAVLFQYN
jgi:hypothetical protein